MRHLRILGIVGLATIALSAACGGSSEPKEGSTGDVAVAEQAAMKPSSGPNLDSIRQDPCQMVTKPEAEAIFGRAAETPSKGRAVGTVEATCAYAIETTRPSEVRTMTVSMMFSPDRAQRGMNGKTYMDNARKGSTDLGLAVQPVPGLADEAFCAGSAPGSSLFLRRGDVVLTVGGNADDCAVARRFAERALARL